MNEKYLAVALDLDGTLLNSYREISPKNLETLHKLHQLGVEIVISSGRMSPAIFPYAQRIALPCSIISYNGAKLLEFRANKWTTLYSVSLSSDSVDAIFAYFRDHKLLLNVYHEEKLFGYHSQGDFKYAEVYKNKTGSHYQQMISDINSLPRDDVTKLLAVTSPEDRDILYDKVCPLFSRHCVVQKSEPEYTEFMPLGVSKGSALQKWCQTKAIEPGRVMAMGDAENDLEMLEVAGLGIATANATQGLKEKYPVISQWTNDEDTVYREMKPVFQLD